MFNIFSFFLFSKTTRSLPSLSLVSLSVKYEADEAKQHHYPQPPAPTHLSLSLSLSSNCDVACEAVKQP
jgi:hypothetical protein